MLDTNPPFWDRWEHLGYAVVLRAVQDYTVVRRKQARLPIGKDTHYNCTDSLRHFERFFKSKYFGAICPELDGYRMFEMLESGLWRKVPRTAHHAKKPTYLVYERHGQKGRERKPMTKWGCG